MAIEEGEREWVYLFADSEEGMMMNVEQKTVSKIVSISWNLNKLIMRRRNGYECECK